MRLLQLYLFSVLRGPFREEFYQCVTHAQYTAKWQERLYSTISVSLMYILPLVVMVTWCSSSSRSSNSTGTSSDMKTITIFCRYGFMMFLQL